MPKLEFWKTEDFPRVSIDGVRHYDINGNKYPSVTTVTSFYNPHKLDKWKKRVGEDTAQKICKSASDNGTHIHYLCEQYLLGNNIDYKNSTLLQKMIFSNFQTVLEGIEIVHLLENVLYSHKLKLAGTVDCVGVFDGILSIIDFKTAKEEKLEEWIENYFVQATFYSLMVYQMYGIWINQIVLLFACSNLTTQVVVKKIDKTMLNLAKKYYYHYINEQKTTKFVT